ncbi:MAG TPA: LppX_LprAFG lipoprotein [Candidatus Dormibacteraeota bacterium]|jgi:lipoprotein LprG|nr:LppX_LprAFG lipoprotein [Candidatus Dormibacteraeota bacterium]
MRKLVASLTVLALAACGGNQPPTVDASRVLHQAANTMALLHTVSATFKFTKAPITFEGFTLAGAKTAVQLPGESDTTFTVKQQDVSFAIELVISDGAYLRLPFSTFQRLTAAQAAALPDLAQVFNPGTGLPAVIPAGAAPRYVSTDKVDGKDAYRIATSYSADQVHSLLAQLNGTGSVSATIWVGTTDLYIHKAVLEGTFGDGGKLADVEVDITGFNATVTITSPSP